MCMNRVQFPPGCKFYKNLQNGTRLNVNQSLDEVHTSYYLVNVAEWYASRSPHGEDAGSIPKRMWIFVKFTLINKSIMSQIENLSFTTLYNMCSQHKYSDCSRVACMHLLQYIDSTRVRVPNIRIFSTIVD